jgi:hypothetical protein
MRFAVVEYIYLLTAISTSLVGLIYIVQSLNKDNSAESTTRYITFESLAPFSVQIVVSALTAFEKLLSAWRSSAHYAVVLWGIYACVHLCLCAHAGYTHDFRPILWIAFLLNALLYGQL